MTHRINKFAQYICRLTSTYLNTWMLLFCQWVRHYWSYAYAVNTKQTHNHTNYIQHKRDLKTQQKCEINNSTQCILLLQTKLVNLLTICFSKHPLNGTKHFVKTMYTNFFIDSIRKQTHSYTSSRSTSHPIKTSSLVRCYGEPIHYSQYKYVVQSN